MSDALKNQIAAVRPNLAKSTLTSYASLLRSLHARVFGTAAAPTLESFQNSPAPVIAALLGNRDLPLSSRKTALAVLTAMTTGDAQALYREQMVADAAVYEQTMKKQEKTETQKRNWIEQDEVRSVWQRYKTQAMALYRMKEPLTFKEKQAIQDFVMISLFVLMPPRRAMDWTEFKIRNVDKNHDNHYDARKKLFVFHKYKTARTYGTQEVPVPSELVPILNKWIKTTDSEWLLVNASGTKFTTSSFGHRLDKLLGSGGRRIAVNSLRHAFLTGKYADSMAQRQEMVKDMRLMGSSINMAETYVKLD